jgi:hypothetical protein
MSRPLSNLLRAAVAVGAWTALLARGPAAQGYDLSALLLGARLLEQGRADALYEHDPEWFNRVGPAAREAALETGFVLEPTPYLQAPLFAVLARPLASRPFPLVLRGWNVAAAAALVAGAFLSALWGLGRAPFPLEWLAIAAVLVVSEPGPHALWLGQTTPFVFALTVGALCASERAALAGALLAVPAFLKLVPAVLVAGWAGAGRWRAVLSFAGATALLALFSVAAAGVPAHRAYLARLKDLSGLVPVAYNNQSLAAALERLRRPDAEAAGWRRSEASPSTRVAVAAAAFLGAAAVLRRARHAGNLRERVLQSGALLGMLVLPGISWPHYFVFLLPAGAVAASAARRNGWPALAVWGALTAAAALMTWPVFPIPVAPRDGLVDGGLMSALVILALLLAPRRTQTLSAKRA